MGVNCYKYFTDHTFLLFNIGVLSKVFGNFYNRIPNLAMVYVTHVTILKIFIYIPPDQENRNSSAYPKHMQNYNPLAPFVKGDMGVVPFLKGDLVAA